MKILHVLSSFPPAYAYGGPVESSYNLSKNLVDHGHEVSVFTTDVYDADSRLTDYRDPEFKDGIRVRRFRNLSNRLAWSANISTAIGIWPALRTEMNDFDIVHLHEFRSFEAAIASYEASRQDIPLVLQPRGSVPRTSKGFQKATFDRLMGKDIIENADRIIASSTVESSQYSKAFSVIQSKPLSQVPNGIDGSEYRSLPENGQFRTEYGISDDSDLILYLGRIHERKGIDTLIRAFAEMDSTHNRHLVIVGPDDGYLNSLQQLQNELGCDNVLFPGPKYGRAKLAAYVDADVFVLPSKNKYESFGNVVIEAMACGTPAITTNVCGVSEWLEHECCFTVNPDQESIQKGIETSLQQTSQSSTLIQKYVRENFTWDAVAEDTEEVYEEVLK